MNAQILKAIPGALIFGLGWWVPFAVAFSFGG